MAQFEEIQVCPYCGEKTKEVGYPDALTYCSNGCGCLEGELELPRKFECQECFEYCDEEKCNCK